MRPPDPLFDQMLNVCGWEYATLTPTARGWVNSSLKELRSVGATSDELLLRARRYYVKYKRRPTPTAMAKHWPSLVDVSAFDAEILPRDCSHLDEEGNEDDERGRYCVRCRTWSGLVQLRLIEGGGA